MLKFNRKLIKTSLSFITILLISMLSISSVFAVGNSLDDIQTLNVEVGIDRSIEIPLTLKEDSTQFYFCGNIGPGDTLKGSVTFHNTCSERAQIALNNVIKNLSTNDELLKYVTVNISMNGEPVYKDTYKNLIDLASSLQSGSSSATLTPWINIEPSKSITMDIECYVSKDDVDNAFQGTEINADWVFSARADVPDDPEEEPSEDPTVPDDDIIEETTPDGEIIENPSNPENVKTGVEQTEDNSFRYVLIGIGSAIGLATLIILIKRIIKNKQNQN